MNIHPTAIVSADARLSDNVIIGPYAVIERDTDIGDCEIGAHSIVKRFTTIDSHNIVHEGVVLGGEPQDIGYQQCVSYLRIGSHNRIREGVTVHRGTQPGSATTIGSGCFIMANAHIAHNCHVGDGVIIANNVALGGHSDIGNQAFISGGVVVHQFCRVGRLAMIGGNSKIVQDCLPFFITDGIPGRARGVNMVGLRRAGKTAGEIRSLKEAYRILLRSRLSLERALARLDGLEDPLVRYLIDFVRASTRGFSHERKGHRDSV